jgi:hypothetical protein
MKEEMDASEELDALGIGQFMNMIKQASTTFTTKSRKQKDWFTRRADHLLHMIGKRNEAERALQTGERTWRKVVACREARSRLKKAIEHARKNWLAEKVDELHI